MDKTAIATRSEQGLEIMRYLSKALGLPDGVTRVQVVLDMDDVVRVDCSFILHAENDIEEQSCLAQDAPAGAQQ